MKKQMDEVSTKGWNVKIRAYKHDERMPQVHRIAHFLNWCAIHLPNQTPPYNISCKAINGYAHTPRVNNEEVVSTRRRTSMARKVLQQKYNRDLKTVPGVGARATVDSVDIVKATLPGRVSRINSAVKGLQDSAALVDVNKLPPKSPERVWFENNITPGIKALTTDERIQRLLPPGFWGNDKGEKGDKGDKGEKGSK
jgi:hypothetical protein